MQNAGTDHPVEDERIPADGPDERTRVDGPDRADQAVDETLQPNQAVDDTIRLNWREKLVEFGMFMAMIMCGMIIGVFVYLSGCCFTMRKYLRGVGTGIYRSRFDSVYHPESSWPLPLSAMSARSAARPTSYVSSFAATS